jgi:hypothetical protein
MSDYLIPLPLAEMLLVTLGPLVDQLEHEHHPWTPLLQTRLDKYIAARDRFIAQHYGAVDVDAITCEQTKELCDDVDMGMWADELHQ